MSISPGQDHVYAEGLSTSIQAKGDRIMPNPITLRNLSGLPATPAALAVSTLVLIDCQNTYREGVMALSGVEAALDEAAAVLARARRLGVPVIHIQHDAGPGTHTTCVPRSAPSPTRSPRPPTSR